MDVAWDAEWDVVWGRGLDAASECELVSGEE